MTQTDEYFDDVGMADQPMPTDDRSAKLPELRWTWVLVAALATATLTVGAVWLFMSQVSSAPTPDSARANLEAIRTALSISIGAGGAFALWLAARRQRSIEIQIKEAVRTELDSSQHREKVHLTTELDLTERRITEMYTKAVEQVGSDKAAVRLGGLYALERLGNATPKLRQTIINVICAYLRMPYPPPAWNHEGPRAVTLSQAMTAEERLSREELQVRKAAQKMLAAHLREPISESSNWGPLNIDLNDAVLIDFRLIGCSIGKATFQRSRFLTAARFDNTTFHDEVWFYEADFERMTFFTKAKFVNRAIFTRTRFGWDLRAKDVEFMDGTSFYMTEYCGVCDFRNAKFRGSIEFDLSPIKGETDDSIVSDSRWAGIPGMFNFDGARATLASANDVHFLPEDWSIDSTGTFTLSTNSTHHIDAGEPREIMDQSTSKEMP